MNTKVILIELGFYVLGIVTGILILRYGIGLGARQAYWQKEDIEPFSDETITNQTHTGNYDFEE